MAAMGWIWRLSRDGAIGRCTADNRKDYAGVIDQTIPLDLLELTVSRFC
jgi:hypothetical protein